MSRSGRYTNVFLKYSILIIPILAFAISIMCTRTSLGCFGGGTLIRDVFIYVRDFFFVMLVLPLVLFLVALADIPKELPKSVQQIDQIHRAINSVLAKYIVLAVFLLIISLLIDRMVAVYLTDNSNLDWSLDIARSFPYIWWKAPLFCYSFLSLFVILDIILLSLNLLWVPGVLVLHIKRGGSRGKFTVREVWSVIRKGFLESIFLWALSITAFVVLCYHSVVLLPNDLPLDFFVIAICLIFYGAIISIIYYNLNRKNAADHDSTRPSGSNSVG